MVFSEEVPSPSLSDLKGFLLRFLYVAEKVIYRGFVEAGDTASSRVQPSEDPNISNTLYGLSPSTASAVCRRAALLRRFGPTRPFWIVLPGENRFKIFLKNAVAQRLSRIE
jgi:hypothetical protein